MGDFLTAIGLMSGTSMDGIDAALIQTDGETIKSVGKFISIPYNNEIKKSIRNVISGSGDVEALEKDLTVLHAEAVNALLSESSLTNHDVDVIGFHGHTIAHKPKEGITVQIGNGHILALLTGINVVNDFRTNDVVCGGEGAPLVPVYHRAILKEHDCPSAIVNIGGVANVTWVGSLDNNILAFDTGPGSALIDDFMHEKMGKDFDQDGRTAALGNVSEDVVKKWMQHPFFSAQPPKSLDRNDFKGCVDDLKDLNYEDAVATLTAFTARSIAKSVKFFPSEIKKMYITGGGRLNKTLMHMISQYSGVSTFPIEKICYNGDALEAQAFGFLAVRSLYGLPISFPTTTGVDTPVTGGVFCPA